jgi:hypothetical protein
MTGIVEHYQSTLLPSTDFEFESQEIEIPQPQKRGHKRSASNSSLRQLQINPSIRKQFEHNTIRRAIAKHVIATGRAVHNKG